MFLKHEPTGELVEVMDLPDVINPGSTTVRARSLGGELIQRAEDFPKEELIFPSGEPLPACWRDARFNENAAA